MDNVITSLTFIFYSMPVFFFALVTDVHLRGELQGLGAALFADRGHVRTGSGQDVSQVAWHMVLPVATLSFGFIAGYSRYIRSTMLEAMGQDYIRTAKAKGLPRPEIVYIHALKNAALPIVTLIALDLPFLLGGAVVTERIFAWPGMGRLFLDHVYAQRYAGGDGYLDDDRRRGDRLPDHRRCPVRLAGSPHPLQIS